ncbi:lysophospholipid acyltransferase family protein [Ferruginibacter yonginensis]|uniref:Lysophospholipid acyltransferase family protein n=1 Tax=Ferruginibacter yonginensis TaxID=1310416 RepID=A0ABV8QR29_9BACT
MYYLLYGLLYLVSLLPFFVLHKLSDVAFFILYYVIGYRKDVVTSNIKIAFPQKSDEEVIKIAKQFYRNLTDNFIETIKLLSISKKQFEEHATIDFAAAKALVDKGLNIQFHSGHQMNWEFASLAISKSLTIPWLAVYMRISAKPVDRLFLKIRSKFGATMVEKDKYQTMMPQLIKNQYALGLIADQNPAFVKNGYWLNFFSKPAPFLIGPEKGAMRYKTAVVFVNIKKIKRGYYHFECKVITEDGSQFKNGDLTRMYRDFLEAGIEAQPANYLWSHRRWKFNWDNSFEKRWIDTSPHP